MSNLVLVVLVGYIIYKESDYYLHYVPNIIKNEIREFLEDDNFMSNIYTRKNYNKKSIYNIINKEVQCEINQEDKEIQYEMSDDLVIL